MSTEVKSTETPADPFHLNFIMQVEQEGFDPTSADQRRELDAMIASGLVWKLQGFWGRLARGYLDWKEQNGDPDLSTDLLDEGD